MNAVVLGSSPGTTDRGVSSGAQEGLSDSRGLIKFQNEKRGTKAPRYLLALSCLASKRESYQAATEPKPAVGTSEMVFRTWEAIW